MPGMDVGAAIEQQLDRRVRRRQHRAMERRAALAIAALHELRLGVEHRRARARRRSRPRRRGWRDPRS